MKRTYNRSLILVFMILSLASCSLPSRGSTSSAVSESIIATNVQLTIDAIHAAATATPAATNTPPDSKNTPTLAVTATMKATITPTYLAPQLTFDNNVNCRQGPGTSFPIVVLLKEGQTVDVVASMEKYWVVKDPKSGNECWLPVEFATPIGSVWTVPTIAADNAPTEVPPFTPVWSKWNYNCKWGDAGQTLTMEMEWSDKNNNETGFRVLRNGETIADLPADSSSYTDNIIIEAGMTYQYAIEVYRGGNSAKSSVIDTSCQ